MHVARPLLERVDAAVLSGLPRLGTGRRPPRRPVAEPYELLRLGLLDELAYAWDDVDRPSVHLWGGGERVKGEVGERG